MEPTKKLATLGMFIIDQFEFRDDHGNLVDHTQPEQIGGGGTYCAVGARIWLPAKEIGMIVDRGYDFPRNMQKSLDAYGKDMWLYRSRHDGGCTTRAINLYRGQNLRDFDYLTPKIRLTPKDLVDTPLARPEHLHFVCSPARASEIMSEVQEIEGWNPTTIYEPIPDRCIPSELPALEKILPLVDILSPNAEEALSILGMTLPATKETIEEAAGRLVLLGVKTAVIIRSGEMGAFMRLADGTCHWVPAFWTTDNPEKIVDVTGAGNAFLGGLAAGLTKCRGDYVEAMLYASVSASYTIEQEGLPTITLNGESGASEQWNGDYPQERLRRLRERIAPRQL